MDTSLTEDWLAVPAGERESAELLAELLHGTRPDPARAHRLLAAAGGLRRLGCLSPVELAGLAGVGGTRGARRLVAALELGLRVRREALPVGRPVLSAADVVPHLRSLLEGRQRECFVVVLLDAKHRPTRSELVSEGCLTWSVVHPREVFAPAVRMGAAALLVAHNHPSGDPRPSRQDLSVTERLARAGETLGIPLVDHVVLGGERWVSLAAEGHLSAVGRPLGAA